MWLISINNNYTAAHQTTDNNYSNKDEHLADERDIILLDPNVCLCLYCSDIVCFNNAYKCVTFQ